MMLAILFSIVVVVALGHIWCQTVSARRFHNSDWNDLYRRIEIIPKIAIAQVGNQYLHPQPNELGMEPGDIWLRLGGMEGLRRLRRNADILIALAGYAERWNYTESVIVRERMRRDALHLKGAVFQIRLRTALHIGQVSTVFHLQESIASYHLMTQRLLALYQGSHAGLYPRLVEVLGSGPAQRMMPATTL